MQKGMLSKVLLGLGIIALCQAQANQQAALKAVTDGNNLFSSKLYDVIRKSSKDNLILSPISVSAVLAMIQAGARGKTAEAIRSSVNFPNDNELNVGYQTLLEQLKSDDSVTLEMANRIYPAQGFKLNPEFTNTLKTYYKAEPQQLNYAQAGEAASTINRFVSNATHDRIKDLISASDLDALTRLVLVNAIYFKGTWKNQFPKDHTSKMDFYTSETDTVKVDMMRLETEMPYADIRDLDAKVVSLPYKGDRLSMVIILPNKRTGLEELEEKLKTYPLEKIIENLRERKVQLYLPKFKLESTIDLKAALTELGLSNIFSQKEADFSGIPDESVKEDLYVSKAIQKAFIEVNEEGSEAAAATGFVVQSRSGSFGIPFTVEHGFISMIIDEPTNTVLFTSGVQDATIYETQFRSLTGGPETSLSDGPKTSLAGGPGTSASGRLTPSFFIVPAILFIKYLSSH